MAISQEPQAWLSAIFQQKNCLKPYISCAVDYCNETDMMQELGYPSDEDYARWKRLTQKQRACLDLVIERKGSKEIAVLLGISKDTVDQRITAARKTLGAADRNAAAIIYARLRETYDCVVYDTAVLPPSPPFVPSDFTDGESPSVIEVRNRIDTWNSSSGTRLPFEKIGRHDHGAVARVAIYTGFVLAAVLIWLGGLNIAETLSRLVSR